VVEGKVPPDLFSLSDSDSDQDMSNTAENFVVTTGGRLGGGGNFGVDLAAALPDEEDAVQGAAQRFRRAKIAPMQMNAPSLDEQNNSNDVSAAQLQDFILDALDAEPEPAESEAFEETMRVDIEHTGRIEAPLARPEPTVTCPHCAASNPPGMKFCVECGGSLAIAKNNDDVKRKIPPPSDLSRKENPWKISLVSINEDGSDGVDIPLQFLETTIGREGDTRFPTDAFLSPKHARLHIEKGSLFIEDLYSLNGTFLKLRDEVRLTPGDTFLMGRQILRFERFEQAITPKTKSADGTRYMGSPSPGGSYKVLQIGIGGVVQNVYCLPESGAVLGREKGDIIFPHDKFMSSRHAQIYAGDDGSCYLVDLNSSNGTWIKIWERTNLQDGDFIFMGQQLFRIHVRVR
jgi:pSer/pThr/pTyr-binding forkhead associated (FHA) protein